MCNLPRLDHVRDGEDGAEENADSADDDVCDTEERVLTSHDGSSRDQDGLGATE